VNADWSITVAMYSEPHPGAQIGDVADEALTRRLGGYVPVDQVRAPPGVTAADCGDLAAPAGEPRGIPRCKQP